MQLPALDIDLLNDTKDDVQKILQTIATIKAVHSPNERLWQEHALVLSTQMITTDVFPVKKEKGFDLVEIEYDPIDQILYISTQDNSEEVPMDGQSPQELFAQIKEVLLESDIELNDEAINGLGNLETEVDVDTLSDFWKVLQFADGCLRFLKSELRDNEISNVNLWSHNFDIALNWISKVTIDETKKDILERNHNITFGFSAGDSAVKEPYFYGSFYKWNDDLASTKLDNDAYWNTKNWNGAVLKLSDLSDKKDVTQIVMSFYNSLAKKFKEMIK